MQYLYLALFEVFLIKMNARIFEYMYLIIIRKPLFIKIRSRLVHIHVKFRYLEVMNEKETF